MVAGLFLLAQPATAGAGLADAGNQLWSQDAGDILGTAGSGDNFGYAVAAGDFNGDGIDDLAVGVIGESLGPFALGAGSVNVIYGSRGGLASAANQLWSQNAGSILDSAENSDGFGWALATGDFNGDGFDDLAVGVPNESLGILVGAGAVNLIYGSSGGLTDVGNQLWTQDSSGILGAGEALDAFGFSVAAGDFDGDGYDDLAVGVPEEDLGGGDDAGAVNVIYGSSAGLTAAGNQLWHQDVGNIEGGAEENDQFGYALAAGDFDGEGYDDLAVGVPFEDQGSVDAAGAVNVIYGSSAGLADTDDQLWSQDATGILGSAESGDVFGFALAAGDFDGAGIDDLAIGVPGETLGAEVGAGAVNVIYGSGLGLTDAGNQLWSQDAEGILDDAESGDNFGYRLAVADFDGSGMDDLAVGVPLEEVGSLQAAGAVHVIHGSALGLADAGNQLWSQEEAGILDAADEGDAFGWALAAGDFYGDGIDDLAIGVPFEDTGSQDGAGAVNVIYGLGLVLREPVPGNAGALNTITATGATPGATVYFVAGVVSGATAVPGCSGSAVGMGGPVRFRPAVADAGGNASLALFIPGVAQGRTTLLQAVEASSCTVSNLRAFTFGP